VPVPEPFEPVPEPGPLPVRLRVVESFIVPGPVPGVPVLGVVALGVVLAPVDGLVELVPGVPVPAVPVPAAAAPALPVAFPFIAPPVALPLMAAPVSAPGVVAGATLPPLIPMVVSVLFSFLLQPATVSAAASASMPAPVITLRMMHSPRSSRRIPATLPTGGHPSG
jgi:hypothetical protein